VLPAAAVLLGQGDAHDPRLAELGERVTRHSASLLPLRVGGHDLLLDEVAGEFAKRLMVLGEQGATHG
jgi:hypothetical protein